MILDLDGLLWIGGAPAEDAASFLGELERQGIPFCILTNDCSTSRAKRTEVLRRAGLKVDPSQLLTPPTIAAGAFRELGIASIAYLGNHAARSDLAQAAELRSDGTVDAVVIGDLFDAYDRHAIEYGVDQVLGGARLIALQRKTYWSDGKGRPRLDVGFWVLAFEGATGVDAILIGKPDSRAYIAGLNALGLAMGDAATAVMISDDVACDLEGAHRAGLRTLLVADPPDDAPNWLGAAVPNLTSASLHLVKLA